jgi:hypothetical protein
MIEYNCDKLTSEISKLPSLIRRVDLAVEKRAPGDGVSVFPKLKEIVEPLRLRFLFSEETYKYLLEVLGDEEEIRKRIYRIRTTGMTGAECLSQVRKKDVYVHYDQTPGEHLPRIDKILEDGVFIPTVAGKSFYAILLTAGEIDPDFVDKSYYTTYGKVLREADELGFGYLPHEAAVDLLFQTKLPETEWETNIEVVTKPFMDEDSVFGRILAVQNAFTHLAIDFESASLGRSRNYPNKLFFSLRPSDQFRMDALLNNKKVVE